MWPTDDPRRGCGVNATLLPLTITLVGPRRSPDRAAPETPLELEAAAPEKPTEAADEEGDDEIERDMDESMWEAALLVGEPGVSVGDSVTIVVMLVACVIAKLVASTPRLQRG